MILNSNKGLCFECNEGIFNPICPNCLAKQLDIWFKESRIDKKVQKRVLLLISNKINKDSPIDGVRCAICNDNETRICPYCLTEAIYLLLKRLKLKRTKLEEFFTYFNYDFEHTGYSKDFEEW